MTATTTATPERLYLMELMRANAPMPDGSIFEWIMPCYLVRLSDGRHILIDSGWPADQRIDEGDFLPTPDYNQDVIAQLADLGLQPSDISTVIATHLDPDHVGHHDDFPHAEFIVQQAEMDAARAGNERYDDTRVHWDAPGLRYRTVEGDIELLPGLTLIAAPGHTLGHQSVLVRLPRTGPVLLVIDAVGSSQLFVPDPEPNPFNVDHAGVVASTRKLLALAEREKPALVVFGHDGAQWGTLKRSPDYYD